MKTAACTVNEHWNCRGHWRYMSVKTGKVTTGPCLCECH